METEETLKSKKRPIENMNAEEETKSALPKKKAKVKKVFDR